MTYKEEVELTKKAYDYLKNIGFKIVSCPEGDFAVHTSNWEDIEGHHNGRISSKHLRDTALRYGWINDWVEDTESTLDNNDIAALLLRTIEILESYPKKQLVLAKLGTKNPKVEDFNRTYSEVRDFFEEDIKQLRLLANKFRKE